MIDVRLAPTVPQGYTYTTLLFISVYIVYFTYHSPPLRLRSNVPNGKPAVGWALDQYTQRGELTVKKRIHVNQHNIRKNNKRRIFEEAGDDLPIFTVKTYKGNTVGNAVHVQGPSTLVYSPDKPLSCGAKVWIETEGLVTVNTGRENVDL